MRGTWVYKNDLGRAIGCSMCHRTFNSLCRVISNAWVGGRTYHLPKAGNQPAKEKMSAYKQQDPHELR